jgi:hypothetical protein
MRGWGWLFIAVGCARAPDAPPATITAPVASPWSRPDAGLALTAPRFAAVPALGDLSGFGSRIAAPRPDSSHRGAWAVGNGVAFAQLGLADPLNTLHGLVGPVYDKGPRFFGDTALVLEVDGAARAFDTEWIGRLRGTGVVLTAGEVDGHRLEIVDLAPIPRGVGRLDRPPVLLRQIAVTGPGPAALVVEAYDPIVVDPGTGLAVSVDERSGRWLGYVGVAGTVVDQVDGVTRVRLRPDGTADLAMVFATDPGSFAARAAEVAAADPARWTTETIEAWTAWSADRLQIEAADPLLVDWLDELDVMIELQRSALGGVTPMSRYTGTWLRDTIGPTRLWGFLGRHEASVTALDYLVGCHALRGDIGNSCVSGLRPEQIPAEPDWSALPPFSGRTAAEGPSHLPLMYDSLARWIGDSALIDARWAYLSRAVLAQTVDEGGLQPWSGDETFRLAMAVALGWPLEHPWQDLAWSSNSSWLMIAAAQVMSAHAARRGEADPFGPLADRVRDGLARFIQPEGHAAAFLWRDPAEPPDLRPFEDANLAALWSGALSADDPMAVANLTGLLAVAGRADGSVQSPPDALYVDLGTEISGGVATGMVPGYALVNFVETGHPSVDAAFAQLLVYASPSGQYDEGLVYSDRAAFSPLYDRSGTLGDAAARYRPWEGGINGEAGLRYLIGRGPDTDGVVHLAPRTPSGLDRARYGPLRVGDDRIWVERRWEGDGWAVTVEVEGGPRTIALEVPLGVWSTVAVDSEGEVVEAPLGERRVRFEPEAVGGARTWWIGQAE